MFFAGGFLVYQQYRQLVGYGTNVKLDSTMFGYTIMIGVISSIFCSLFVSTDYNDGTIRNKVIAGSRRAEIYIANLIVNIVTSFLLCFSYILANIVIGIPLIGTLETPLSKALLILVREPADSDCLLFCVYNDQPVDSEQSYSACSLYCGDVLIYRIF